MKLTAIALLKWNGDKEPVSFGMGADLSSFGFFQRGSVKEMLTFVARTVAKRTLIGQRQTVQNEEYYCHAFNRDGLVSIRLLFQCTITGNNLQHCSSRWVYDVRIPHDLLPKLWQTRLSSCGPCHKKFVLAQLNCSAQVLGVCDLQCRGRGSTGKPMAVTCRSA